MQEKELSFWGTLEPFHEQGMEGFFEYAFQFEDPSLRKHRNNYPFFLQSGHSLVIYSPTEEILWEGVIEFVSTRYCFFFVEKHDLPFPVWNPSKPKGISYRDWVHWFWHEPKLKAKLVLQNPEDLLL